MRGWVLDGEMQHAHSGKQPFQPVPSINVYLHLGKLGGSSAGNFGHAELREFIFQVVQLLQQLLFLLAPQVSCLDLGLNRAPFARHWM